MKIAYYLPSLEAPGGLERIVTYKANYFAEQFNYEVTIITSEQMDAKPHFPLSPKVRHIDLRVPFDIPYNQSRPLKLVKYPFRYYKFKKRLTETLNKIKPDITISTLRRELTFINKINDGSIKIGEFHVTRYSYGAEASGNKNIVISPLKKLWSDNFIKNLNGLSKLVLLTHESAQDWPELNNITVIPNPISTPTLNTCSNGSNHQAIAVGRYAYQKGFDMLIKSWKIVSDKHPDWILRIYGEGALREELQKQIDEAQLTETCKLEHTVTNIADKYCESSIFVLSSRFEGLPLVLGESMAYGVPPVAFTCPCGPRDMITDQKDGLLVENGNTTELAEKIIYLIENEEIRKKMGEEAKIRSKDFLMENISLQWKKLFEQLVNAKHN